MDPTPEQVEVIRKLRRDFGTKAVTPRTPNKQTGIMRVELQCQAGTWHWWYNTNGDLVDTTLVSQLFIPDKPQHRSGNALDN